MNLSNWVLKHFLKEDDIIVLTSSTIHWIFFFILGVTFLKSYIVQWLWWSRRTFVIRRLENKIWCVFLDENISPTSVVFKGRLILGSFSLLLKFPKKCAKSPSWALSTYPIELPNRRACTLSFFGFFTPYFQFLICMYIIVKDFFFV